MLHAQVHGAGMQHGRGHAAWTEAYSMDITMLHRYGMQLRHGHTAWTWPCNIDMNMENVRENAHGHGYAAWEMDMHHCHGHAAWKRTRTFSIYLCMLQVHAYVQVHAAYQSQYCVSMSMRRVHVILKFHVYVACPCPWCMSMSNAACSGLCSTSMSKSFCMTWTHRHTAWKWTHAAEIWISKIWRLFYGRKCRKSRSISFCYAIFDKFRRNETKYESGNTKYRRNFVSSRKIKPYFGETLVPITKNI